MIPLFHARAFSASAPVMAGQTKACPCYRLHYNIGCALEQGVGRPRDVNNFRELLINSVIHAEGIFLRPAAAESLVHSAAVSAVSFLAGQKNPLF